jgi:hypothetical protein
VAREIDQQTSRLIALAQFLSKGLQVSTLTKETMQKDKYNLIGFGFITFLAVNPSIV